MELTISLTIPRESGEERLEADMVGLELRMVMEQGTTKILSKQLSVHQTDIHLSLCGIIRWKCSLLQLINS